MRHQCLPRIDPPLLLPRVAHRLHFAKHRLDGTNLRIREVGVPQVESNTTRASSVSFHISCSKASSKISALPTSQGRTSSATRKPQRSGDDEGTMSGRWTRRRRLAGDVCAAMRQPGASVEKKVKAKGMSPVHSPGIDCSAAMVFGHRSCIFGRAVPRSISEAQCHSVSP